MDIKVQRKGPVLIIAPQGRLDAYGAQQLDKEMDTLLKDDDLHLVLDLDEVTYLSSGGIRSILSSHNIMKDKGGCMKLCHVNPYPMKVLETAGFDNLFSIHPHLEDCVNDIVHDIEFEVNWDDLPLFEHDELSFTIKKFPPKKASLTVVGDISKVLFSTLEPEDLFSRQFRDTEYSIGLGGLGDDLEDYSQYLGEMITIGGTMIWLPTDGHDTPDFLIPLKDTGLVTIHTGFNVALDGHFQFIISVEHQTGASFSISRLYGALFKLMQKLSRDYRGVVSVAMQADLEEFYSSGINISPLKEHQPTNREMIMHPDNVSTWIGINQDPLYKGETMVSFGVGVDLTSDLSGLDEESLNSVFYLHPANIGDRNMLLHNHAVIFKHQEIEKTPDLDSHIRELVQKGDFLDMRHLLDYTRIKRAVLGLSIISDIKYEV